MYMYDDEITAWLTPTEHYVGTIYYTAIYTEHLAGNRINYIFRHRPAHGEPLEDVVISARVLENVGYDFSGSSYAGTFFGTSISVLFENGEPVSFRGFLRHVSSPPPIEDVALDLNHDSSYTYYTTQPNPTHVVDGLRSLASLGLTLLIPFFIFFVAILFAVIVAPSKRIKKKKSKSWDEKFKEVKDEAEKARVYRGWLPKNPNFKDDE